MIRVALDGNFDATTSQDLRDLRDKLDENGIEARSSTIVVPGVKADLVIGLTIASLTMTTVSTLINVIDFWKNQRTTAYRISFETPDEVAPCNGKLSASIVEAVQEGRLTGIKIEKQ